MEGTTITVLDPNGKPYRALVHDISDERVLVSAVTRINFVGNRPRWVLISRIVKEPGA